MPTSTQFAQQPSRPGDRSFVPDFRNSPFSSNLLIRALVTAAFFVTLMQYWLIVANAGLIPIFLIYGAALISLLGVNRTEKLSQILSGGAVLFLFSILSELVSYYTGQLYSVQYGLILLGLFLAARLIIMHIGMLQVVRCYTYSAIVCTLIVLVAGRKQLSDYGGGTTRFTGGAEAHPNLMGFTFASYIPLFIGVALDLPRGKKRLFMGGLAMVTIVLLFTTGSRGSLGAVIIALVVTALRFTIFNRLMGRLRLSGLQVMFGLLAIGGLVYILMHGPELARITKFVVNVLQLESKQRGIHSGFSGRTGLWMLAISRLSGLEWLFGKGYRQAYIVDSGYVTILFDNGLVGGSVILGSMLRVFFWLWRSTTHLHSPGWWRYHLVLWSMMIIYFINNITTRYLFSYGNQFSLLVIFLIVCRKDELLGTARQLFPADKLSRRPAELLSIGRMRPLQSR